ncbi:MAG: hypothetical protein J7555_05865 [Chloroflexi bacterium]|nr:hypothetical protein [Chloroflexota bacterium]
MKQLYRLFAALLAVALFGSFLPARTARAAGILYAAPSAMGSGNCASWANACTLRTALTNATSGDQIWVKKGVHYPGASRTDTFTLKNGVALYGGFAGTETLLTQRNWQVNKTILSGDIDHNDTDTNSNGIIEPGLGDSINGNNAYHVVRDTGTDNTAVLDGFVITAGQANGSLSPNNVGGGMKNHGYPTLRNLILSGNFAIDAGGGMYNSSHPALTNVTFSGNSAQNGGGMHNITYSAYPALTNVVFSHNSAKNGGGMYSDSSTNPRLTNVTFSYNSADTNGGGMYNITNSSVLMNVTFIYNSANNSGGGMFNWISQTTLTNVTFSGNSANNSGGGMYSAASKLRLTNVTFSGNSAYYRGGGMYNHVSSPSLVNVTFSGNTAILYGGGMYNGGNSDIGSNPRLTNVTFSGNSANSKGGGMYNQKSNPTLTNVILWGDSAPNGPEIYNDSSTPVVTYSDVQGGYAGTGNINADPLFVNAAGGNLHLQLPSPAIDAGNNSAPGLNGVTTDLDGHPRFVNIPSVPDTGSGTPPIVDMGAYEVATFSSIGAQHGWILESTESSNPGGISNAIANTLNIGPASPSGSNVRGSLVPTSFSPAARSWWTSAKDPSAIPC